MNPQTRPFADRSSAVHGAIQSSLASALNGVGLAGENPTNVSKALGLDLKLAWKVDRLLAARKPADSLQYVPGRRGQALLVAAYASAGASAEQLEQIAGAFAQFEALVAAEGGSRKDFDALLAAVRGDWTSTEAIKVRRSTFDGQSSLLGIQAELLFGTVVFTANASASALDVASVRGFVGLRALRPGVTWRVGQSFYQRSPTRAIERGEEALFEPLEPKSGAPILRDWCTSPLPELIPVDRKEGLREYRIRSEDVGASTAVDLTLADRHVAAYRADPAKTDDIRTIQQIRTPARRMVNDTFIERDLFDSALPEAEVYSTIFTGVYADFNDADLLPLSPEVIVGAPGGKDPRLAEIHRDLFRRLGRDMADFDRVRVELAYPPVPASLRLAWRTTP